MRIIKKYNTFLDTGRSEIIQKKSKFLGCASYVSSEDEIKQILENIRKSNYGASHNCYAYRLEGQTVIERQSDDGEPSGTAGLPILDVLRGAEIINGIIVVTRFFGGTLLGTGGLVKAYGQAAKQAAESAGIILKEQYQSLSVTIGYSLSGKIEYELNKNNIPISDIQYTDKVLFKIYVHIDAAANLINKLTDITDAAAGVSTEGIVYGGILDGKFKLL